MLHLFDHFFPHFLVVLLFRFFLIPLDIKAQARFSLDEVSPHIGGQDKNGVAEINFLPLRIAQMPVFHNLKQRVERFGVGLLDFVKQNDGVGPAAHCFG